MHGGKGRGSRGGAGMVWVVFATASSAALSAAGCGRQPVTAASAPDLASSPSARPEGQLLRGRVRTPEGRAFEVEVVQDEPSRQRGLQHRARLGANEGMLFIFPRAALHRFWMHECLISLDIVWLDADRRVVHVEASLPPCRSLPCPDYGPESASLYVLELAAGVAERAGIRPGVPLEILFSQPPRPT